MGYNIFNNCSCISLDDLQEKLEEYMETNDDFDDVVQRLKMEDKTQIVLIKFDKEDIEFLVSNDEINFSVEPSKTIENIKLTWFDEGIPKQILFESLSKLSLSRKTFHESEYFVNRIKKVYFRYINNEIRPYRYSLTK